MNFWRQYFESNRLGRTEPDWAAPVPVDDKTAAALARSLAHFQLGESGGGSFLFAEARRADPDDADYHEALTLFVAEEQEHARLLGHLVARYGGRLVNRHWTHACFKVLRRALGVRFEIEVLLIAELIGTAYYRLLHEAHADPVLDQVCELILADEARHVDFHADRFAAWQDHWLPLQRDLWSAQFQLLLVAATRLAAWDHRAALAAAGQTRRGLLRQTRREAKGFLTVQPAVLAS